MKRVVLVNPSGPRNVGMILRSVANFGPCEITLVAPELPSLLIHPEFEQMSHGVTGARERCMIVDSLDSALSDCTSSVGFTARVRGNRKRLDWRNIREGLAAKANDPDERLALVFGNEVSGLEIEHTDRCQELVHIPTAVEHTSLNLAVSVGIVLSALFSGRGVHRAEPGAHLVNGDGREFLKANLKHVFGTKVARTPAARRDIEEAIDRVFSRATIENRDARAWHLMLRALGSDKTPQDFGLDPTPEKGGRRSEALCRAQEKAAELPPLPGDARGDGLGE